MPFVEVRTEPALAVPLIFGRTVLTGAPATIALPAEVAVALPAEFEAVTATFISMPTSAFPSVYVVAVEPLMAAQLAPVWLQRSH